jgi:hypothetical protein
MKNGVDPLPSRRIARASVHEDDGAWELQMLNSQAGCRSDALAASASLSSSELALASPAKQALKAASESLQRTAAEAY